MSFMQKVGMVLVLVAGAVQANSNKVLIEEVEYRNDQGCRYEVRHHRYGSDGMYADTTYIDIWAPNNKDGQTDHFELKLDRDTRPTSQYNLVELKGSDVCGTVVSPKRANQRLHVSMETLSSPKGHKFDLLQFTYECPGVESKPKIVVTQDMNGDIVSFSGSDRINVLNKMVAGAISKSAGDAFRPASFDCKNMKRQAPAYVEEQAGDAKSGKAGAKH